MDPSPIIAGILTTISILLPFVMASVKNPASKAKLKHAVPGIRAGAAALNQLADAIDAASARKPKKAK